ncbi:recombinase family protein [Bradyrhizobium sp. 142]|uniref:recombinase family protein n=1 Tax=Bradyrhizobium sp. 142 TaxID=2782618 RepID=UPI001FF7F7F3|nr:recombinase family protein [Bradyrhizobium sp. 142]
MGSARQALCWLQEYKLDLPVKQTNGDTAWRRPSYSAIQGINENPVYGGACAYGKMAVAAASTAEREREDPPQDAEPMVVAEAQYP